MSGLIVLEIIKERELNKRVEFTFQVNYNNLKMLVELNPPTTNETSQ